MSIQMQWRSELLAELAARFKACFGVRIPARDEARFEEALRGLLGDEADLSGLTSGLEPRAKCEALEPLLDTLAIKETYFFREPRQFQILESTLVPELIAGRPPGHTLRVLSAGCATGEEAYSLAAMLDEMGWLRVSQVAGVDICPEALERARSGVFGDWSLRQDASRRILPHAQPLGARWQIAERLRDAVRFERLNLVDAAAFEQWGGRHGEQDLIVCRNVFIYFDRAHVEQVARSFFQLLAPGGILLLGSTDPMLHAAAPFEVRLVDGLVVYQRPPRSLRAQPTSAPPAPQPSNPTQPSAEDEDLGALFLHINELSRTSPESALERCESVLSMRPESLDLRRLHAALLLGLGRHTEALRAAHVMVQRSPEAVIGHLMAAVASQCLHDPPAQRKAMVEVLRLLEGTPDDSVVPHTEGESAANLREAARRVLSDGEGGEARDD